MVRLTTLTILIIGLLTVAAVAQDPPTELTSTSFKNTAFSANAGGNVVGSSDPFATSSSFRAFVTAGQPAADYASVSNSFNMFSGYPHQLFPVDATIPTVPVLLTPTQSDPVLVTTVIDLDWTDSVHGSGIAYYEIEIDEAQANQTVFNFFPTDSDAQVTLTGQDVSGNFFWRVRAIANSGFQSEFTDYEQFGAANTPDTNRMSPTYTGSVLPQDYRMFSVPAVPVSGGIEMLEAYFGPYDPTVWRLFRYNASGNSYNEFPNVSTLKPGMAYWILSKNTAHFEIQGNQSSGLTPWTIDVPAGFSQIGPPYPGSSYGVNLLDVDPGSGAIPIGSTSNTYTDDFVYEWNGTEYVTTQTMSEFGGYWFHNTSGQTIRLVFNDPQTKASSKPRPSRPFTSETVSLKSENSPPPPPGYKSGSGGSGGGGGGGGCLMQSETSSNGWLAMLGLLLLLPVALRLKR